jgi:2-iminoacetate synthase
VKRVGIKKNIKEQKTIEEGVLIMYDCKSKIATEFIDDKEIQDTLAYAQENKSNRELINSIIERARDYKGLSHREAAVLLECDLEDENEKLVALGKEIKQKFYGNRIVMFAPLYLSNYCVNGCVYCPYHLKNKHISRKKLTQEDIKRETIALQDMGHKRLALEAGEDPVNNPIEYILESIKTIYGINHKNGAIRRVNVNIAATTIENYKKLKDAGIGTYILFQETYNKKSYEELHPTGPKHNYDYHTEAMDRAMEAGIDDVGIGVLYGLNMYRYDFVGLLMHAEHLEAAMGVGPHTISMPRIRPADDIDPDSFSNAISDEIFAKIITVLRIAVPYTGMIVSTRESKATREKVLELGVTQISGGSRTSVGGYAEPETGDDNSAQFDVDDSRTLDEIVNWLLGLGYIPSFCTACYREGRTGDRFMNLVKSGQIANCCQPNALMTLKEYLEDYASEDTKSKGEKVIDNEIPRITNEKVRKIAIEHLTELKEGKRDFRF